MSSEEVEGVNHNDSGPGKRRKASDQGEYLRCGRDQVAICLHVLGRLDIAVVVETLHVQELAGLLADLTRHFANCCAIRELSMSRQVNNNCAACERVQDAVDHLVDYMRRRIE